jgi:hypothetical protein
VPKTQLSNGSLVKVFGLAMDKDILAVSVDVRSHGVGIAGRSGSGGL